MSFLDKIFNTNNNTEIMQEWIQLNDEKQIEEIIETSKNKPVVIFKHSIRCGISAHAKSKLETAWNFDKSSLDFYYLDLINFREISNKIAEKFSVLHQSPQIIIVKNGKAISSFSHQSISIERIAKEL